MTGDCSDPAAARMPEAVMDFWYAAGPDKWFNKSDAFDAEIAHRFADLAAEAAAGRLDAWSETPEGALALVLLLDQFPRNMYRGTARAFASDAKAQAVADAAIARGFDTALPPDRRQWLYLPFEHAEDLAAQERSVALFEALGNADSLQWAVLHRDIIARFGRFPHRNAILGRSSTPEEERFLAEGGFAG